MTALERVFSWFLHNYHFYGKTLASGIMSRLCGDLYVRSSYGPLLRYRHRDITWAGCFYGYPESVVPGELDKIPSGGCLIDIGANIGVFSLYCARQLGVDGLVLSFEVNPATFADLVKNIDRNRPSCAMVPFNVGLADRYGRVRVSDNPRHSGASHVVDADSGGLVAATTDWRGLDWLEELIGSRPTFIKIDVEGMELSVLNGVASLLDGGLVRSVIVEIDAANLHRYGATPEAVYGFMTARGFRPSNRPRGQHYDEVFTR